MFFPVLFTSGIIPFTFASTEKVINAFSYLSCLLFLLGYVTYAVRPTNTKALVVNRDTLGLFSQLLYYMEGMNVYEPE